MEKNLTVGNPNKVIWQFCLPLFGSIVFQQLYNIADSFVAGKFIDEFALAAVGNSYEITLIFIAFAFGCNIGTSVIISKLFGANKIDKVKDAIFVSYVSSAVLCFLLMVIGIFTAPYLLKLIRTPDNIFNDSLLYLYIYIGGLAFLFFYNIATGIFTALGDSKTPFIFLAISSIANILVDIFFVKYLYMGIAGVAWATFICQGISCVVANIVLVFRLRKLKTEKKGVSFSFSLFCDIAHIAIPSILQQSFISIGNIVIQSLINGFGSSVIAGYSAAIKYNNFAVTSFTTLGNGISNYTAQNLGANKVDRVKDGFKSGLIMVACFSVVFSLIYFFAGQYVVKLFMNDTASEGALMTGIQFLKIVSPFYIIVSSKLIADGILRGAGSMKLFMISTFTDLILRVGLSFLFSNLFGSIGIWISWPIGWTISMIISMIFYVKGNWEHSKKTTEKVFEKSTQAVENFS